jgi:hypothetical protein
VAWLDAATASDSVTYKPEVGEVAGSSPTSRSVLFLLFILSSLSFFLKIFVCCLRQAAFVNFWVAFGRLEMHDLVLIA